jgi:hypothetical protein
MITATSTFDGPPLVFNASVNGVPVYLDNDSLIELAKGDSARRQRFVNALSGGADLMFSMTNAAELVGPQGQSLQAVKAFLDEVGPHWFPVGIDLGPVLAAEARGVSPAEACVSKSFVKAYFSDRTSGYSAGSGKVIVLSDDFFSLSAVLDWLQPQRPAIRARAADLDKALLDKIMDARKASDADSLFLDRELPVLQFDQAKAATFAHFNLARNLVLEAKSHALKKGDGCDFCHAVMGTAFGSFATLDKHWKRRIQSLPTPNCLARIYYRPELDQLVSDVEMAVKALSTAASR